MEWELSEHGRTGDVSCFAKKNVADFHNDLESFQGSGLW